MAHRTVRLMLAALVSGYFFAALAGPASAASCNTPFAWTCQTPTVAPTQVPATVPTSAPSQAPATAPQVTATPNCGLYPWACQTPQASATPDCGIYPWACQGTRQPAPTAQPICGSCGPQPGIVLVLGFRALHDLNPVDIGDPTENQWFAPNGDAQQHTAKGLLVWRKADNWTAFTNGYVTWINGPSGLVRRLNTERCAFEADAGTYPSAACDGQ